MILDLLRLAVGVPLVLLAPGWAWSLAAFPRSRPVGTPSMHRGDLDAIERCVVAFALSVALVPLAAIAWSRGLGLPLGTWGSLAVVAIVLGTGIGAWRWRLARRARPDPR